MKIANNSRLKFLNYCPILVDICGSLVISNQPGQDFAKDFDRSEGVNALKIIR